MNPLHNFLLEQVQLVFPGYENYFVNLDDNEIIWGNDLETTTILSIDRFIEILRNINIK